MPRVDPCQEAERLLTHGRIDEATALLAKAVERRPEDARLQETLGNALLQDGRLDGAARALEASLRLDPRRIRAKILLSDVHAAGGAREPAEKSLREALGIAPASGPAWLRLVHLRRITAADSRDLDAMRALLARPGLAAEDEEALHFALGKAYDDLGQADDAFSHFERANRLHRSRQPFDLRAITAFVQRIEKTCDARLFERLRGYGLESELPVFVVGVPRCGSTLVEQIIASHPLAYGVGELRTLARLTADLPARAKLRTPFPDCLREIDAAALRALGTDYLRRLSRDAPEGVARICDKMLSHVLLIGLIAAVFPRARVVHVSRDPLASGWSMYTHSFSGPGVGYAYDLAQIGAFWKLSERLVSHFRRVSPAAVVSVDYEALARDPEPNARRLIEALGLEWDARCLDFHRAERQVRTVSDWQVREPIHTRSLERWKRYEKHLAPLRAALGRD